MPFPLIDIDLFESLPVHLHEAADEVLAKSVADAAKMLGVSVEKIEDDLLELNGFVSTGVTCEGCKKKNLQHPDFEGDFCRANAIHVLAVSTMVFVAKEFEQEIPKNKNDSNFH